jgi:pyochelin biosynthetic protein PchC
MSSGRPTAAQWLRAYRPRPGAALKLFCFPHASGNATFYRDWAVRLPPSIEVNAVQYPGRLDRIAEPCLTSMEGLVSEIAAVVAATSGGPFALFGHSMGASVAYEVAHRLEFRYGLLALRLMVSGRPAPKHQRPGSKHLGTDDLLWEELRRLGGTGQAALDHPELRAALMPALRADYRLIETYQPTLAPPISVPVKAFSGDSDPEAPVAEVADWEHATSGEFEFAVFAGGHFYLVPEKEAVLAGVVAALNSPAR